MLVINQRVKIQRLLPSRGHPVLEMALKLLRVGLILYKLLPEAIQLVMFQYLLVMFQHVGLFLFILFDLNRPSKFYRLCSSYLCF
uniref:Uncharacterized protein n=2 Tax=Picea TaxID=3328 RepID=A0A117NI80_PICGL|nr:hypothetical protein ABT39_MTgene4028 [Picea glauca]QHR89723.1 hypothetical protein Q903MT_gene3745 [Picea sitchensis]